MEIPGEISLLCRLCLANDEVNVPIFGEQSDIRQISLKISSCLPVKIAADDLLPKNICEGCSDKLELLYTFSKTSQEAEKKLLVWVEQVSVNNASEAITAVAKQIVDSTEVKEESDEGHKVNVKKSFDELVEDAEEKEPESEAPPPKRARRTAAVKAQISISQESEDEDDVDMVEPLTKVEDESEVSDSESVEPHSSFVDVPGTSADEQQPGPSGVQKDGADAPKYHSVNKTELSEAPNIHDSSSTHPCPKCRQIFPTMRKQRHHVTRAHRFDSPKSAESTKHACAQCNKAFTRRSNLLLHIKYTHEGEEGPKYQCDVCGIQMNHQSSLAMHKKVKHLDQLSFSCEYCGKRFVYPSQVKSHLDKAHRLIVPVFLCDIDGCGKAFKSASYLKWHQNKVHLEKKQVLKCDYCGKEYTHYYSFRKHVNKHKETAPKSFCCKICGKVVTSKTSLEHHTRSHTGERPFSCKYCGKGFISMKYLKTHLVVHTKERPHGCAECDKAFTQRGSLMKHMRKCHPEKCKGTR